MELWFIFAVASAFTAGIESFIHKVAAMRKLDVALLNLYGSFFATIILVGMVWYLSNFENLFGFPTLLIVLATVVYVMTFVLKVEALKHIDAAIFYPIYKITGPLLTIIIGILFFGEYFTLVEWSGLLLSLCVPLLLITKTENSRQNNLKKGLLVLLLAAVAASISISLHKKGVDLSNNVWLLLLVGSFATFTSSLVMLYRKHGFKMLTKIRQETSVSLFRISCVMGVAEATTAAAIYFAFVNGGSLGIVYTIASVYILIPIVLSIIFYKEHWNLRKISAIGLSILALALLR